MIDAGLHLETDGDSKSLFVAQITASTPASQLYWQKHRRSELIHENMIWFVDNLCKNGQDLNRRPRSTTSKGFNYYLRQLFWDAPRLLFPISCFLALLFMASLLGCTLPVITTLILDIVRPVRHVTIISALCNNLVAHCSDFGQT